MTSGKYGRHAWNLVKIANKYYHSDITNVDHLDYLDPETNKMISSEEYVDKYGIREVPALMIDNDIISKGCVLTEREIKNIIKETQNYKTILMSPLENLHIKYSSELDFAEKVTVYNLEKKTPFKIVEKLKLKTVETKEDLLLWGRLAYSIYDKYGADFIYESFKMDIGKKHATYFIFYKGSKPVGISQIIRGAGYSAVYWVGVLPEYRRKGYAYEATTALMQYCFGELNIPLMTASTSYWNDKSMKLLDKLGLEY